MGGGAGEGCFACWRRSGGRSLVADQHQEPGVDEEEVIGGQEGEERQGGEGAREEEQEAQEALIELAYLIPYSRDSSIEQ